MKFDFPGMSPGDWCYHERYEEVQYKGSDGLSYIVCTVSNPANGPAIAALPDILSRLAKLEKVLEAAKRVATQQGYILLPTDKKELENAIQICMDSN
jgi:hypothetical protein